MNSATLELVLFGFFAVLTILSACGVIFARNPIASAMSLVATFFFLAGIYVLLWAHTIAALQVLVYAGAIMVLFLFVIMLLNLNKTTEPRKSLTTRIAAVVAGGLFFLTLLGALRHGITVEQANPFDPGVGLVRSVGMSLFSEFLLPFEVSSVLFLSAMVGVVMLGKKDKVVMQEPVGSGELFSPTETERRA